MGALLKDKGKEFELVATDGHRLALDRFPQGRRQGPLPNVLVPKKALAEILKMDGGERRATSRSVTPRTTCSSRSATASSSRACSTSTFPTTKKSSPRTTTASATRAPRGLQGAIRRVALFSSERSRGVKLSFEKNLLTIASASQELGEGTETLDVEFDGEPLSIGLNAQYLLDFLDEAETESVRLELKDENTQCICRPEGEIEGTSRYLYVVMPMRL